MARKGSPTRSDAGSDARRGASSGHSRAAGARSDAPPAPAEPARLSPGIGATLQRIRTAQGFSLDALAKASGVSRAMLSQIEHDKSMPTVNLLWKVAMTLGVPFVELLSTDEASPTSVLRAAEGQRLVSASGGMTSRPLSPGAGPHPVEFRELRLAPLAHEAAEPHGRGAVENLVVASGVLEVSVADARQLLRAGDAVFFSADVPHSYRNPANSECLAYVVIGHAPAK